MTWRAVLAAVACLLAGAGPALAQAEYDRPGFYVGAGIAVDFANSLDSRLERITGRSYSVQPSFAIRSLAGYRIHPRAAAELQFEYNLIDFKGEEGGAPDIEVRPWMVTANAKGYILTGQWQPFVTAGVGVMHANSSLAFKSATVFAARFGAGIDVVATDHVTLTFDFSYALPTGSLADLDYFSLGVFGLQYRF